MRGAIGVLACAMSLLTAVSAVAVRCDPAGADAAAILAARTAVDAACDCNAAGQSHGEYLRCAKDTIAASSLRQECRATVKRCYSRSTCGRPGAVTCCRTRADGGTRCNVRRDAAHCTSSGSGTACVGSFSSCCDACGTGGCATTTTSTSSTTSTTLFPEMPCIGGSGSPACDGTCDPGFECRSYSDLAIGSADACACFPVGSSPCDDAAFPQCGGLVCPGSKACGGFQSFDPSSGQFVSACACVEASQPCMGSLSGGCASIGYCAPPLVCQYTPIAPHVICPCCGCGMP